MFETTHLETSKETNKRIGHPIKKSLTTANISNNHRVVSNVVSHTDLWKSFPSEMCQFQNDIPPKVTDVFPYVFLRNQWIWHLILRPPQNCRTFSSRTRATKRCGGLRHTYQMRVLALKKKVWFSGFWWIFPFSNPVSVSAKFLQFQIHFRGPPFFGGKTIQNPMVETPVLPHLRRGRLVGLPWKSTNVTPCLFVSTSSHCQKKPWLQQRYWSPCTYPGWSVIGWEEGPFFTDFFHFFQVPTWP